MLSTDKQTNKQTDKLTNATKNITSFAKEVIIQKCSGKTRGRVLNGKLYAQIFQKLIYLYSFTDCFIKINF